MAAKSLQSWIDGLQSRGRYTFTRAEALRESGLTMQAATKALQRSVMHGRLVRIKSTFFVLVPLEYKVAGCPPVSWFISDLMAMMGLPYYVGLLTAAGLHGASHQQPQIFQVVTDRSVRTIAAGRTRIVFTASKYVEQAATVSLKTPTGLMKVSSPETTLVDLVRFAKSAGHLDHVAEIVDQLTPLLDGKRLVAALRVVDDIPNTQRVGYLLEILGKRRLSRAVHEWVKPRLQRTQLLRPGLVVKNAPESRRWRLLINAPLELER